MSKSLLSNVTTPSTNFQQEIPITAAAAERLLRHGAFVAAGAPRRARAARRAAARHRPGRTGPARRPSWAVTFVQPGAPAHNESVCEAGGRRCVRRGGATGRRLCPPQPRPTHPIWRFRRGPTRPLLPRIDNAGLQQKWQGRGGQKFKA